MVFVEDEGCEAFYLEFISCLMDGYRVQKVVALGGRENVLRKAREYNGRPSALFVIDGDLSWVAGDSVDHHPRLFQHPCYCIENYLFCKKAALEIAYECHGKKTREAVEKDIQWEDFYFLIREVFVDLFVAYAVSHKMSTGMQTTKKPVCDSFSQYSRSRGPEVDPDKVREYLKEFDAEVVRRGIPKDDYDKEKHIVRLRINALSDPVDAISGKNYLFPLLELYIRQFCFGNSISSDSLKLRLSKCCSMDKAEPFKNAIISQILQK